MLRYTDYDIVFREIPDETTLAVNLAGCPNRCPGCHSPQLQEPIGEPLTEEVVERLLVRYGAAVTCFCLMGGDAEPHEAARLALFARRLRPALRTGWYSGRAALPEGFDPTGVFDYVKLGPYIAARGPLDDPATNQRLWRIRPDGRREDLTPRFWRRLKNQLGRANALPNYVRPRLRRRSPLLERPAMLRPSADRRPASGRTADKQTKESGDSKKMLTFTSCFTGFDA